MLKEISIEIIRKCPNYCLHCSSSSHRQCTEILPYGKFKEIVLDAAKLGAKTICLSGGEPFLHDKITEMVQFVNDCGLDCYIYTSGIALDTMNQPVSLSVDTLKKIRKSVTKLIFNIEAGTEKTYDKIMGTENCFEKMKQSATRAIEAGICTEAHFVPMAINVDEIHEVIRLCKCLHISKLSFLRLVLHGRAGQNSEEIALSPERTKDLKAYLCTINTQLDISVRIGVPLSTDTSCNKCEAAKGKLNIKYDGEVFPCEVFKNYSMDKSLDGLRPDSIYQRSLLDIYNNSEYLRRVREMTESFSRTSQCETCVGQHLIDIEKKEAFGE